VNRGALTTNGIPMHKQVLTVVILIIIVFTLQVTGITSFGSRTQIGYFEDIGADQWSAHYIIIDGPFQRDINPGEGPHNLNVHIDTKSGNINLAIIGTDGTVFYSRDKIPTSSFVVPVTGTASIHVYAQSHRGSFSIKW